MVESPHKFRRGAIYSLLEVENCFFFVCRCCVFLFRVWCSLYDVEKASVSSFCWWVDEKSWKSLPSGIRSTCIKMKGRPKPSSNLAWMFLLYLVFPLQNLHKNLDAFLSFVAKKTRFRPRVNRRSETQDRLGVLHETSICKKKHHDVVQDTWYETKNITMLTGALLKIQNLWALYGVVVTVAQQRQLSRGITVLEHFSRMILKEYYILLCL